MLGYGPLACQDGWPDIKPSFYSGCSGQNWWDKRVSTPASKTRWSSISTWASVLSVDTRWWPLVTKWITLMRWACHRCLIWTCCSTVTTGSWCDQEQAGEWPSPKTENGQLATINDADIDGLAKTHHLANTAHQTKWSLIRGVTLILLELCRAYILAISCSFFFRKLDVVSTILPRLKNELRVSFSGP